MHQELPSQYYLVVDEKSTGPFSLEEILMHPALTPETLVWKPGIENWVAAQTLPELAQAFIRQQNQHSFESQNPQFDQNPNQFQPQNNPNQNSPYQNYPPYTQNNPYNQYQNNPYNNRYNPYQNPNPYQRLKDSSAFSIQPFDFHLFP